ncbi:hypothetical protein GUJ93_ZPchr0007g4158 [Zizania palustris]|uniref:Uncharacterized protein n=1 Tax=Zizania palustris TaxID=103762 RepID=A0A8J5TC92_ZIZPA|nr:hypothetical protein GUJ93_ZPchr0007g4158 [Zizania palustris]
MRPSAFVSVAFLLREEASSQLRLRRGAAEADVRCLHRRRSPWFPAGRREWFGRPPPVAAYYPSAPVDLHRPPTSDPSLSNSHGPFGAVW